MKKRRYDKATIIAGILILVFIVSLVPIISASFYNHASYDDLGYSASVHHTWLSDGGFFTIIKSAFETAVDRYFSWQGTFSAIFIFALQPGAFSDDLYFLTTFIMLAALVVSTIFLLETILVRWLGQKKSHMIVISLTILFIQIQFVPSISEGFFWFNGSSYYTLFYSFALVLFSLIIRLLICEKKNSKILLLIISSILAIIIGGGNYTTSLFSVCTITLILTFLIIKKNQASKYLICIFSLLLISFIASIIAPGNLVRASSTQQMNPIFAIIMSFFYSIVYIGNWTTLAEVVALLFLAPLIYMAAQKSSWCFQYPFLVIAIVFGLFACQFTPPLYAMSSVGSGRQINIYFYSYILMLLFDIFYLSGWISKKYSTTISIDTIKYISNRYTIPIIFIFALLFGAGCLNHGVKEMTSIACTLSLLDGSAKQYDSDVTHNIKILESETDACYINEITECPIIFMSVDLSEDNTYWVNRHYANFYDCESVNLAPKSPN